MHVPLSFQGIHGKDRKGYFAEPMVDEKISDLHIIKPFPAGIPDMKRDFHAGEKLD
jgi:hypothetical protein